MKFLFSAIRRKEMKSLFLAILMVLVPTVGYARQRHDPSPTVTLSANPTTIVLGQCSKLSWTSQNATSLNIVPGVGKVNANGSKTVTPEDITTYTLTATGPGGTQTSSATVSVMPPPSNTLELTYWIGMYWDGGGNWWNLVAIQPKAVSISGTLTMTVEVTVVGDPTFNWRSEAFNTCYGTPATVRPFIMGTHNTNTTGRWWAVNPNEYVLAAASTVITVPLTPAYWSDVVGQNGALNSQTIAGFNDSLKNLSMIGMTFGGGCFFGHGVSVSGGTAEFQVVDYQIIS
jgi:hypothetical protein